MGCGSYLEEGVAEGVIFMLKEGVLLLPTPLLTLVISPIGVVLV